MSATAAACERSDVKTNGITCRAAYADVLVGVCFIAHSSPPPPPSWTAAIVASCCPLSRPQENQKKKQLRAIVVVVAAAAAVVIATAHSAGRAISSLSERLSHSRNALYSVMCIV